jgi:hypothetical protein
MMRLFARLMVLLAVLLMPFGMAAPAEAHAATEMSMPSHCPDPAPARHEPKGALAACTMACASALPAMEAAAGEPLPITAPIIAASPARRLDGLHPETATPPPKAR